MIVYIDDNKYIVKFTKHPRPNDRALDTNCKISVLNTKGYEVRTITGFAHHNPIDKYNKITGKKLALARALDRKVFTRSERCLFWEAFYKEFKRWS